MVYSREISKTGRNRLKPRFQLACHDSTHSMRWASRDERVESCCFNMVDGKQAIVLACISLVAFSRFLSYTNPIFSIRWNKLNKCILVSHVCGAYLVELVVSSVSNLAVRQFQHSQNAWARHVERVELCSVERWRAKWNLVLRWRIRFSEKVGFEVRVKQWKNLKVMKGNSSV